MGTNKRIPLVLKQRTVHLRNELLWKHELISRALGISVRSVENIMREHRRTGSVSGPGEVMQRVPGRPRRLSVVDVDFIVALVERTPDILLTELQEELWEIRGMDASIGTIWRALNRRGFTRKKLSRVAAQRDEQRRAEFKIHMSLSYTPEQLVFVDESACNRRTSKRAYGWARRGEQARRHDVWVRGIKYSVLPALSLSGVIHLDAIPGSFNGAFFNNFIRGLLDKMNPFPGPNSVIVMDNASIHKSPELRPMIEARGVRLEYLPPYSPDYDPIEEGFSGLKAWIRKHRTFTDAALAGLNPYAVIWKAVYASMTPEKARGWYKHSGYL